MASAMPEPLSHFTPRCHVGGFAATNGYAFRAPTGWIGVDAPSDFAAWLREQDIKLSALLLTHAHFDHVMDAAVIAEEHGCEIYAWEISTPQTRLETFLRGMAGFEITVVDYPVHHTLKTHGHGTLMVCGLEIRFAPVPGHSPDSVIFHLPSELAVFSGDTLMNGTMGRTDFPEGSTSLLVEGMRRELLSLPEATRVFSGHGDPTTIREEKYWVESLG